MAWSTEKLGDLCTIAAGGTPSRGQPRNFGGDIPWVKIGDMARGRVTETEEMISRAGLQNSSAKLLQPGTLLLSIFATVGRTAVLEIEAATNQAIVGIVPRDSSLLDSSFLRRYLDFIVLTLVGRARGVAQVNINLSILKSLDIPLPPLPEQRRIASILDDNHTLRQSRKGAIDRLELLAAGVFDAKFGNPDTTTWPVGTVADLISSASYGTSAKAGAEGDYVVLRMGNLTSSGALDLSDLKRIDIADKDLEKYLVRTDDVLFNRTNSAELVGKSARYSLSEPMAYAGYLVRLRPRPNFSGHYLAGFLNSSWAKTRLRGMAKSIVGMANINAKEVQKIPAPIPSAEAQAEYATKCELVEDLRNVEQSHLAKLDELFASLQHRAFRGEL